jgi:hypothetical protein
MTIQLWNQLPADALGTVSCKPSNFRKSVKNGWDGMDWMDLAQDRDQWRALVNTVMKLRVP